MGRDLLFVLLFGALLILAACGSDEPTDAKNGETEAETADDAEETTEATENGEIETLVVGASNVPHAEILEEAAPLLEEEGIELVIETFQDYILPNTALEEEDLDANYFQHIPYLNLQIEEHGYDFVSAGGIHIEPIGLYSKRHESIDDIPEGGTILMGNSVANHGRALAMLEREGLLTLDESVDKTEATVEDIVDNPLDLQFNYEFEESYLPQVYENDEGDAVLINSNYALDVGLNPLEDSIAIEESDSPYANVIAVRNGDEEQEKIKKLVEILRSDEIQQFILDQWGGSVVPVSE